MIVRVRPVHPGLRDPALRGAATRRGPCRCGRRNCNVNLNNLRWDRPHLDCEPQQARGIPRNLQLDETIVVVGGWDEAVPEVSGHGVAAMDGMNVVKPSGYSVGKGIWE
jgi:hypothetical protein